MASGVDIDGLIAATLPILDALEEHRQHTGAYPESLADATGLSSIDTSELVYRRLSGGNDYELMQTHSHWISSFNALVYSPDGLYRPLWNKLLLKEHRGWRYAVGAQEVYGDF